MIHVSDSPSINGRYEYAVLSINCNYPLYVIARNPAVFQQVLKNYILNKVNIFILEICTNSKCFSTT